MLVSLDACWLLVWLLASHSFESENYCQMINFALWSQKLQRLNRGTHHGPWCYIFAFIQSECVIKPIVLIQFYQLELDKTHWLTVPIYIFWKTKEIYLILIFRKIHKRLVVSWGCLCWDLEQSLWDRANSTLKTVLFTSYAFVILPQIICIHLIFPTILRCYYGWFLIHCIFQSLEPKNFVKLDRFDGTNFNRWKDKMMYLLTTLNVTYVLNPKLEAISFLKPLKMLHRKRRQRLQIWRTSVSMCVVDIFSTLCQTAFMISTCQSLLPTKFGRH